LKSAFRLESALRPATPPSRAPGERAAGGLDANPLDGPRRGHARGRGVVPDEAALAHPRLGGKAGDTEVAREMRHDPVVQALEGTGGILKRERRAVLRLPAGAFQEDDQLAGDGKGGGAAEVILDEGKREADPGGDPGRRPYAVILDEDRVALDMERGETCGELGAPAPMRGRRGRRQR
jgi:hypothetical protein